MKRLFRREEGQTAIEFALAMPFILMFIFFIIDMALLGFSVVSVTNAVREGARCGAVGATDAAVIARVDSASALGGGVDNVSLSRGSDIGSDISVGADYNYSFITPVGLVPGISGELSFSRESVMRMETTPPYEAGCG